MTYGRFRRMFPGGNTSRGFVSFYDHIAGPNPARRFIIKGGPGVGKSTLMKKIGKHMLEKGYDIEYHHCSSDNNSIDAVMIPALRMGIMDGTAPHVVEPVIPGAIDEVVSLSDCWDEQKLLIHRNELLEMVKRMSGYFKATYSLLKEASVAYDERKSYVNECFNKSLCNSIVRSLIKDIFAGIPPHFDKDAYERHLFGSAITPGGLVNYADTLIHPEMKVYTLSGQPGSGVKDTIARLAQAAFEWGFDTEQFHCPFEPDKLDMIIIPAINVAVMNISAPFGYVLSKDVEARIVRNTDLDTCVDQNKLEKHSESVMDSDMRVKSLIDKAVKRLSKAKSVHDDIEGYYINAMNFDMVDRIGEKVLRKMAGE